MLRLITDFDGPIVDVSDRYYCVYRYCLDRLRPPDRPVNHLSKPEFWQLKRSRTPERKIGTISGLDRDRAREFATLRGKTVHSTPYLHYDTPIPGAVAALERAQRVGIELVVLTMRRQRELEEALYRCELDRFFPLDRRYCIGNDEVKTADTKDKPRLLARALTELPPVRLQWMVGDTEADAIAARTQGVKFIAVLSGIRDRRHLERYNPDLIVSDLAEAVDFIVQTTPQPVV
ncbi:MAG: HAD family hydrolase [Cyanobacteria bacterium SID2]|nr:HAD family hydrolase [Cyanobacteria bacterium SID2]MBP0002203.1 HAD family hydrolase [Cyanobacteria bacterium SBC]